MTCPCCPTDCTVSVGTNAASEVHAFDITLTAEQTDVPYFGVGEYGRTLACKKSGTINIETWCPLDVETGDTSVSVSIVICDTTVAASDTTVVDMHVAADMKGSTPPSWRYSFRINEDVSIT